VLFAVIVGFSILFLVTWAYVIFGRPSVFCGAAGLSFSYASVFVISILAIIEGEENLMNTYDFMVDFAAYVASRMQFTTMRHVAGCGMCR
jgi:hypothetical protein